MLELIKLGTKIFEIDFKKILKETLVCHSNKFFKRIDLNMVNLNMLTY